MLDIVYVTYNSEKWLKMCFDSWDNSGINNKNINIIVVDNASEDHTVQKLREIEKTNKFQSLRLIELKENKGFGYACNLAGHYCRSDYICFFNIDTALTKDTLPELLTYIIFSPENVAVWELRQLPYEHPKYYNPITLETEWVSGAAFAVRKEIFMKTGGFDEHLFMYAEDVDISLKIRLTGAALQYCPKAAIYHYSYTEPNMIKPIQYAYQLRNNQLLRYRYGNLNDLINGYILFIKVLLKGIILKHPVWLLWKVYWSHLRIVNLYKNINKSISICFNGLNYSYNRHGAFYLHDYFQDNNRVIIFVSAELKKLQDCLITIQNQTISNITVIIYHNITEITEYVTPDDKSYISVISHNVLLFADHLEILIGSIREFDGVAGTVDHNGKLGEQLDYYVFSNLFWIQNKEMMKNDEKALLNKCLTCSQKIEKETLIFQDK